MGYNTMYTLEIQGMKTEEDFMRLQHYLGSMDLLGYAFQYDDKFAPTSNIQTILPFDECHWYDNEEDMIRISYAFPNFIFCLYGAGENQGDVWKEYFHKGKYETCIGKTVYPEPQTIEWKAS